MATEGLFPPLERVEQFNQWRGQIVLPSLAKCCVKWAWSPDSFFPSSRREASKGPANLYVDDAEGRGPDQTQHAAMKYLVKNEVELAGKLLDLLKADLLGQCRFELTQTEGWDTSESEDRDRFLHSVKHGDGITDIVALSDVTVYKRQLDGCSYLSFTFMKGWDWDHGLIFILHKDRIVDSGDPGSLCDFEEDDTYENEGEPVYGYYS